PFPVADSDSVRVDHCARIVGYRLEREISRGGQAAVYQAIQETTGRKVAIKIIAGGPYITSRNRARFEREVQILATLDHPGIVRIVDRGRTEDGSFFFVMDYIDGDGLDEYFERCRHSGVQQAAVVELFRKIASALEEAH